MKADLLLRGISQLVTPQGGGARRGSEMRSLRKIHKAAVAVTNGRFSWVGPEDDWDDEALEAVDLGGRAVVPGLVDPHTHAIWAGNRLADFEARTSGVTYEQILAAGGGIWSTIRATAAASQQQLIALALPRIEALLHSGATIIEIKSGYGFDPAAEIAMLQAIRALAKLTPARLSPTLLIHVPPPSAADRAAYISQVAHSLIPQVAAEQLANAVDIFIEKEAWSAAEAETILTAARQNGLVIKVHTEQFHRVGGLELAVQMGALSADHLEACTPEQFETIANSSTVATILPGVTLHLGLPAAPGRKLIDAGAAVAIGTDLNPGSSPLFSTAAALALAVRLNGLTAEEALTAATANAAAALGLDDAGRIQPGVPADFCVLASPDWRDLAYSLGINPVHEVWVRGQRAFA